MNDALDLTPELQALVEQLGTRDYGDYAAAETDLADRGETGIAAVLWGLSHPTVRVRGGCAGFLDHHGTDACFEPLRQVALHDPAPSVRLEAVHSASCQECKPCPLKGDLVGLLVEVGLRDPNRRVRLHALWGLRRLPQDPRARTALSQILRTEADLRLRSYAHHALKHQDPSYKAAFDAKARERGMAAARARNECPHGGVPKD